MYSLDEKEVLNFLTEPKSKTVFTGYIRHGIKLSMSFWGGISGVWIPCGESGGSWLNKTWLEENAIQ